MKRNIAGHEGKTKGEKQFYSDYIRKRDYTPTVDESLKFDESTDDDKEFSIEKNAKRRKRPIGEIISEKWEEYWFQVISGIVAVGLTFFVIEARVGLAQLFERTDNTKQDINEIKGLVKETKIEVNAKIEKIEDDIHDQDLLIRENQVKIDSKNSK